MNLPQHWLETAKKIIKLDRDPAKREEARMMAMLLLKVLYVCTPKEDAMTMEDMKCDVCGRGPAVGVASTSMPMSVAYCQECADKGADPEIIFTCMLNSVDGKASMVAEGLVTYKDGKYMTFHEWAKLTPSGSAANQKG